ncbi:MAG: hydantoinase/oxoprolinase N-terminal domain-containing protein, partial [Nitrososphaerota archaeon]
SSGISGGDVTRFVGTGSTLVINAIIERKGVKTALITTKGFRDVLEIQRSNRPDMYNYSYRKPKPFVPRYLRFEVLERIASDGSVLKRLSGRSVAAALRKARSFGVESIAICLYNSYANPSHERAVLQMARRSFRHVSASHEITREWREYERMNTTVLNAYVKPILEKYLTELEVKMRELGIRIPIHVIQSNGGVAVLERARETPILQIESEAVSVAFGMVPAMIQQVTSIFEAQRSRGWSVSSRNPLTALRRFVPTVLPIITSSISRSEFIAAAMASRVYGYNPSKRTSLRELRLTRVDWIFIAVLITFLVLNQLSAFVFKMGDYRATVAMIRIALGIPT